MTIEELLDQAANDAGDNSTAFRNSARRWLNLARSYIADRHRWRAAVRTTATLSTAASTARYALTDASSNNYERVISDIIYNQTNDTNVFYQDLQTLLAVDPDQDEEGTPSWWADAGSDSSGNRLIQFYPIPDAVYVMNFAGYLKITDITSADDTLSVDPFYGPISPWASCFAAGLRYYQDLNNNESDSRTEIQRRVFEQQIRNRRMTDNTAAGSRWQLQSWRQPSGVVNLGTLDPSVFPRD